MNDDENLRHAAVWLFSEPMHASWPPGAMPWADLFGPFRTKSEEHESWLHFRQ
jgi:hypothetical protein